MAKKSKTEKINELTLKINSLSEQREKIDKQIGDLKKKRSLLQTEVDSENFSSLMALGIPMEELMKMAKERAEEKELEELEKTE